MKGLWFPLSFASMGALDYFFQFKTSKRKNTKTPISAKKTMSPTSFFVSLRLYNLKVWVKLKAVSSILSFLLMGISLVAAAPICYDTGNFSTNSTYGKNRDLILSSLPLNVSANGGFFNATIGQNSDKVYALGMCRGDSTPGACYFCVNYSIHDLMSNCPNQIEAYSWGGDLLCLVRFANRSFYGILELDPVEAGFNTGDITSNLTEFDTVWETQMVTLVREASKGSSRIKQSAGYYQSCCHGKQGGYVQRPNCFFRWDLYPFYVSNALSTAPSTPASPPIITIGQGSDEQKTSIWVPLGASLSAALGLALFSACGFFILKRRNIQEDKEDSGDVQLLGLMVGSIPHENSSENFNLDNVGRSQEFPSMQLDILLAATNSLCDENKLGQGGFGPVYKKYKPEDKFPCVSLSTVYFNLPTEETWKLNIWDYALQNGNTDLVASYDSRIDTIKFRTKQGFNLCSSVG
ncbi:hypothetical protein V6N11_034295 [Hibiscus sabdariffa]|uniref:Gnk2-homologous domain-containing protein n=1 Tax=Hibiscus sabdariffa TaxID=183260 RepID=A0ABR2N8B7_9ROSI